MTVGFHRLLFLSFDLIESMMQNKFCLVTSLFNIQREKMSGNDGRSWGNYLEWFEKTLRLKTPMIIFCENDLVDFVKERREHPTEIVTRNFSEIPYLHLKDEIQKILSSDGYQNKIGAPERIECQHSMYNIIQYSKFKWLDQAISLNPFSSRYFFWIDAGASRHFDGFDTNNTFPSQESLELLDKMGEKFLLQMNMDFYQDLVVAETLTEEYFWDARAFTCGSFFGGELEAVKKVNDEIHHIFINKMIKNGLVNTEQTALGYLLKTKPYLFLQYRRYNGKHMDMFTGLS